MAITHFTPTRVYTTTEGPINPKAGASATVTTATTPVTITVAQMQSGVLFVNTVNAGAIKFPTAIDVVAGIQGCAIDTSVFLWVVNTGAAALTPAVGTGGTLGSGSTAAQATLTSKLWFLRVTSVTSGSEAYTLWSLNAASLF